MKSSLKIGTRGSKLALYQAELTKGKILNDYPSTQVEIVVIKTKGDMIRRGGLSLTETKRVFTREIEDALLQGDVDIAVHSAKDMAAVLPEGTAIGAVLEREDPRDCFVTRDQMKLSEMPMNARIGTSSLRRRKQLLRYHPELVIEDIRGNVDSRIQKMTEGYVDGVVLAYAGIKRLGLTNVVTEVFDREKYMPAPGQGIIVVQIREGDSETAEVLHTINHKPTQIRLECERAFLRQLQGGCQLPCGMISELEGDQIKTSGILFDAVESHFVEAKHQGLAREATAIGTELAQMILSEGGAAILEKIKQA